MKTIKDNVFISLIFWFISVPVLGLPQPSVCATETDGESLRHDSVNSQCSLIEGLYRIQEKTSWSKLKESKALEFVVGYKILADNPKVSIGEIYDPKKTFFDLIEQANASCVVINKVHWVTDRNPTQDVTPLIRFSQLPGKVKTTFSTLNQDGDRFARNVPAFDSSSGSFAGGLNYVVDSDLTNRTYCLNLEKRSTWVELQWIARSIGARVVLKDTTIWMTTLTDQQIDCCYLFSANDQSNNDQLMPLLESLDNENYSIRIAAKNKLIALMPGVAPRLINRIELQNKERIALIREILKFPLENPLPYYFEAKGSFRKQNRFERKNFIFSEISFNDLISMFSKETGVAIESNPSFSGKLLPIYSADMSLLDAVCWALRVTRMRIVGIDEKHFRIANMIDGDQSGKHEESKESSGASVVEKPKR